MSHKRDGWFPEEVPPPRSTSFADWHIPENTRVGRKTEHAERGVEKAQEREGDREEDLEGMDEEKREAKEREAEWMDYARGIYSQAVGETQC